MPGIGPRRRRTLLTTFGSLAGVRRATREELAAASGEKWPMPSLRFSRVGLNLYRPLRRHQLRADLHRLHRAAVFPDRARDRRTRGRPIGSAIRRRGCSDAFRSIPIVHADLIGTVRVSAAGDAVGICRSSAGRSRCRSSCRHLRHPRRDYVLVAAAGPASNLVLAVVCASRFCSCPSRRSRSASRTCRRRWRRFSAGRCSSTCCWRSST